MEPASRAERRAAPEPARLAMWAGLKARATAVPQGNRSDSAAFSAASPSEGPH
jgi:hypothetical protein